MAQVSLSGWLGPFEAELLPGDWNGWVRPRFTREVALRLVEAWNATDDEDARASYDADRDVFVFYHPGTDDPPDEVGPDADGLYPIGTDSWIWCEDDEDV